MRARVMLQKRNNVILIIEDDIASLQIMAEVASEVGTVHVARTGSQGIGLAKRHSPDLILLDLRLPDMSGFDVFAKVYERHANRVMFVTADNDRELEIKAIKYGACDYLYKPVNLAALQTRMQYQLAELHEYKHMHAQQKTRQENAPQKNAELTRANLLHQNAAALENTQGADLQALNTEDLPLICKKAASNETLCDDKILTKQALQEAIEQGQICLHYQAKVDTQSGKVTGFEALARWQLPNGKFVMPDLFIPLAERSGLICALGECVLERACSQLKAWHKTWPWLSMAVNVSALQFTPAFVHYLKNTLERHHIPPEKLEIEVTETVFIDVATAIETVIMLRELNTKLALDDFGKGFSSLFYLKSFQFDILKIDQGFVLNLLENPTDQAIVKTIVNLANDLNLEPVAEGVETQAHVELLQSLGCSKMQGYYFSKPVPPTQAQGMIELYALKQSTTLTGNK